MRPIAFILAAAVVFAVFPLMCVIAICSTRAQDMSESDAAIIAASATVICASVQ